MNTKSNISKKDKSIPCWIDPRDIKSTETKWHSVGIGMTFEKVITTHDGRTFTQGETPFGHWMSDNCSNMRFCPFWQREAQQDNK